MSYVEYSFSQICNFCEFYNNASALKTSDGQTAAVRTALQNLKNWAQSNFSQYDNVPLKVEISKGSGYFPKVPWLAILPPEQKVSDGVYFVLCFGREGAGGVAGCASSVTNRTGLEVVQRSLNKPLVINVNGDRPTTLYNDAFYNPLEITPVDFNEEVLKAHIRASLDQALSYIRTLQNFSPMRQHVTCNETENWGQNIFDTCLFSTEDSDTLKEGLNPENVADQREKIWRSITLRQGQPKFRKELLEAYEYKCAITGTDVQQVLEAAHIFPYRGKQTNQVSNGLLLRADIHILYDYNLLYIEPETLTVLLAPTLENTDYMQFANRRIRTPRQESKWPDKEALNWRRLLANF